MRFWWANQNQTYHQEIEGGYLWSPKTNAGGYVNPFYDNMTKVGIGDVLFSFKNTVIPAMGIITSPCYSQIKPREFGSKGQNWGMEGWCINVDYHELENRIRPKAYMNRIASTLPPKYSPLQKNGNGNQGVYLTLVPEPMAYALIEIIGTEAYLITNDLREQDVKDIQTAEIENGIKQDASLGHTEKEQLIKARRGQGIFRTNVERLEKSCRITGVAAKEYLRASHIKPWRDSTNIERLDGNNGLLLSPHIDALFDKGYIGFDDDGLLVISSYTDPATLDRWNVKQGVNVGSFNQKQKSYLAYHRAKILK